MDKELEMSKEDFEHALRQALVFGQRNGCSYGVGELTGIRKLKYENMVEFMIQTYRKRKPKMIYLITVLAVPRPDAYMRERIVPYYVSAWDRDSAIEHATILIENQKMYWMGTMKSMTIQDVEFMTDQEILEVMNQSGY